MTTGDKLLYIAYGSNLHPLRLQRRVPSARLLGPVTLPGHRLAFHKRGRDGSGKCNLIEDWESTAYGALYEFDRAEKYLLDECEALGNGYLDPDFPVEFQGQRVASFTYLAQPEHIATGLMPFTWYLDLVLHGARYHQFPANYVSGIARIPGLLDGDSARCAENEALCEELRAGAHS